MIHFKPLCAALALGAAALLPVHAQTQQGAAMSSDQISAQYDAAQKHCDSLKGNDKDVCEQQAKAQRDTAKADAKADRKSAEANQDAAQTRRDADYKVAKEKCDAMSGDAKDACIAQAKTQFGQ